ncbi:MAG: hypothetical protein K2Y32_06195 [Candidatus Obscuribacterales bacterium]|nr:hypothetical protein [Candidatus Obscuribacterales bacterium]
MISLDQKKENFAQIIDGKVVDDSERVEVSIKGSISGFKATIEALKAGFPFSTTLYIETDVLGNGQKEPLFSITVTPKVAKGLSGIIGKLLLLDARETPTGSKIFDNEFLAQSNNEAICQRFINYPGVAEKIRTLGRYCSFRELHIQGGKGLVLVIPNSFDSISYDKVKASFNELGELAQILFDF